MVRAEGVRARLARGSGSGTISAAGVSITATLTTAARRDSFAKALHVFLIGREAAQLQQAQTTTNSEAYANAGHKRDDQCDFRGQEEGPLRFHPGEARDSS